MKIERTKNASRNIFFGILLKLLQTLIPFVMRTATIYCLGIQYLGLNSLFTSVLQVLNLAELGVGNAMVFSMYKPIAEDNSKKICALMNLYKVYYRIIGSIVLAAGLILLPQIPNLISGEVPSDVNIFVLYLMNLSSTVLSYWLFAYQISLLHAHQRGDVVSKISMFSNMIQYILQFCALYFLRNYYMYLLALILMQIVNNIITYIAVRKMYPDYCPDGKLPKEEIKMINGRVKDLFVSKIGSVVVNSSDTIVISAFLGLSVLAVYQNYYFILSSIIGFVTVIFHACTAGIGNSLIIESENKNFSDLKRITFIVLWIVGFCTVCLFCLYQPFMMVWVGKDYMLGIPEVICFCVYYFIYELNQILLLYKDAAGMWHEDRYRTLLTAGANLTMNLCLVRYWGLYGVLLSTVLSMLFIGVPWLLHNLFTLLFHRKPWPYIMLLFKCSITTLLATALTYYICELIQLQGFLLLVARMIVCCIIPNIVFLITYHNTEEYRQSKQTVIAMISRFVKKKN